MINSVIVITISPRFVCYIKTLPHCSPLTQQVTILFCLNILFNLLTFNCLFWESVPISICVFDIVYETGDDILWKNNTFDGLDGLLCIYLSCEVEVFLKIQEHSVSVQCRLDEMCVYLKFCREIFTTLCTVMESMRWNSEPWYYLYQFSHHLFDDEWNLLMWSLFYIKPRSAVMAPPTGGILVLYWKLHDGATRQEGNYFADANRCEPQSIRLQ